MRPWRWLALAEALAVFLAIMLYIWRLRLSHPWAWVVILGFVIGSHFAHGEGPRRLGFAWRNFAVALPRVGMWVATIVAALLATGAALGTIRPAGARQAAAGILGYIVWGLFQQYLLNGYFVNRLADFRGSTAGPFVPVAAAALFSIAHAPNWFLMAVTLAAGYLCARVYLRFRSLYVLALAHGVVGFFLFLIVPDSISAHFVIGPRYLMLHWGIFPEQLL